MLFRFVLPAAFFILAAFILAAFILAGGATVSATMIGEPEAQDGASAKHHKARDNFKPQVLVGPGPIAYWAPCPFYDAALCHSWRDINDKNLSFKAHVDEGYLEPATGCITRVFGNRMNVVRIGRGAKEAPDGYFGSEWIIEWTGDPNAMFSTAGGQRVTLRDEGRNRLRLVYSGPAKNEIILRLTDAGKGVCNLKVYEARYEDAVKAGKVWRPEFTERVANYQIIRTLNYSSASASMMTGPQDYCTPGSTRWGSGVDPARGVCEGPPMEAEISLALETDAELWTFAPPFVGFPREFQEVDLYQHREFEGDIQQFAKAQGARFADHVINDSDGVEAWATWFVETLDATGYPPERMAHVELGNEVWNFAWPWAITIRVYREIDRDALTGAGDARYALGWRSAQLAHALQKAVAVSGNPDRQWTVVIGTHTQNTGNTHNSLKGAAAYFAARAPEHDTALRSHMAVATTSYVYGVLQWSRSFPSHIKGGKEDYYAEMASRAEADPVSFLDEMADAYCDYQVPYNLDRIDAHRAIIAKWGGQDRAVTYEGGSHDRLPRDIRKAYPALLEAADNFVTSEAHGRMIRCQADKFFARFPDGILADHVTQAQGAGEGKPWIEAPIGHVTPPRRAWREVAKEFGESGSEESKP